MTQPIIILAECLERLTRAEKAAVNDAAFRKQARILLEDPAVMYTVLHARDAPAEPAETSPKPKRKRTPKPSPDD